MQKFIIYSKNENKIFLSIVCFALIVTITFWDYGTFFTDNIAPCLLVCLAIFSFLSKLIFEIILSKYLKVSSYTNNGKQICVKINKRNMKSLDFKFCYITLSCVIDNELIWQQKEKSTELCFIPSRKTEEEKKNIYRKEWIIEVEVPLKIRNFHIFIFKLEFNIKTLNLDTK